MARSRSRAYHQDRGGRLARIMSRYDALDNLIDLVIKGEHERRYRGRKTPDTIRATDAAYSLILSYMGIDNGKHEHEAI